MTAEKSNASRRASPPPSLSRLLPLLSSTLNSLDLANTHSTIPFFSLPTYTTSQILAISHAYFSPSVSYTTAVNIRHCIHMSSRGASSRGRASGSNAASRPSNLAGPSTHRFAERRQERMRGAGTAVAMQRDFQFKLPPKRATTAATTSARDHDADTSEARRKPGRPRGSGPRQREKAAAAAAAAAAGGSFDNSANLDDFAPSAQDDPSLSSHRFDTSTSIGVARRVAPPQSSGPISSTPAASRIRKQLREPSSSVAGSARKGARSAPSPYADADEEDLDSQIGDAGDYSHDGTGSSAAAAMMDGSPGWDAGMGGADESLPMIPSPAASSSHVDTSVRRMRPSIGGASASRLSIADSTHADSPAARAAQRNLDARQSRRQRSPGVERLQRASASSRDATAKRRGRPPKGSTGAQPRSRALVQEPSEHDETVVDSTMVERQRARPAAVPARPGRELQRRLKRALSLVFSPSELPEGDADDSSAPPSKKRKSVKYLNDVDIIWSIVDEELRSAIEEQPAKAPFLALKALRKSVRSNFLNLSEKTDNRTTLISQLVRARKQKRALRKEVFQKRTELAKATVEARERDKELRGWRKEVTVSAKRANRTAENF